MPNGLSTTYGQSTRVDLGWWNYSGKPSLHDRNKRLVKILAAVVLLLAIVIVAMTIAMLRVPPEAQAKLFDATLDADQARSGLTRKAELAATTEDQARVIARETLHWPEGKFSVVPTVKNYLTVRVIEVTP